MNLPEKPDSTSPPERMRRLQAAFAAHLRDPEHCPAPAGIEERRLAIYRRLFFGNLRNLMARNFPVLRRLLDESEWDCLIRQLMTEHRSSTPLFPEIGSELLAFIAESGQPWLAERPWMAELIHWEYLETLARLHEAEVPAPAPDLIAGAGYVPSLNPTLQMARYRFPVHQISPSFIPSQPLEQPVNLLVYRRHDDQVAYERVNDFTLRYLLLMQSNAGLTALALLQMLAEAMDLGAQDQVIDAGWRLLKYLGRQEIISPPLAA